MQDLLATYLFQHGNCPLPGIGTLHLNPAVASILPGEQRIAASAPSIELVKKEVPVAGLVSYLSAEQDISEDEATANLRQYCRTLKYMGTHESITLTEAGKFSVSADGNLVFTQKIIDPSYQPPVTAEKVIRPNDSHNMLVGDTETTNTVMTEFYNDEMPVSKNRWWAWAAVLFVIAIGIIALYFSGATKNDLAGNKSKILPGEPAQTYKSPN